MAPIGHARQGALDRVHVDPVVLGIGLPVLVLVVVLVSAVPAWRLAVAHCQRQRGRPLRRLPTSNLSPSMAAGLGMAAGNGGRDGVGLPVGTAMAGVVLASSVLVVAPGLVASLHHLVATPAGYGATWDRSISALQSGEPPGVREHLGALDGV